MQHSVFLFSLLGLLVVVAGGVFLLVNQDAQTSVLQEESFVGGVGLIDGRMTVEEQESEIDGEIPLEEQAIARMAAAAPDWSDAEPRYSEPSPEPSSTQPEQPPPAGGSEPSATAGNCQQGQIDINIAPKEELLKIIHIGDARADELIQLRPFSSLDDLARIKGIGDQRVADIKVQGLVCVG